MICSARDQEIYWRIALLAYDEPIKTLHGSVKMTGTQKPVRAITFAAPKETVFVGAWITIALPSDKTCRRLSTNQRDVTMVTWLWGLRATVNISLGQSPRCSTIPRIIF